MKQKIMILNVCRYKNKTTNLTNTAFEYIIMDNSAYANHENYVGNSVLKMYLPTDILSQLANYIGKNIVCDIEYQYTNNPMKPKVVVKSFSDEKGNTLINLV